MTTRRPGPTDITALPPDVTTLPLSLPRVEARPPPDVRCQAGDHLIEVEVRRPCSPEVLVLGLERMGWTDVLLDQSIRAMPLSALRNADEPRTGDVPEWGSPEGGQGGEASGVEDDGPFDDAHVTRFRFVGRLASPIVLRQRPDLVWIYARQFEAIDPFGDLRLRVHYFKLVPDALYEIRWLSRLRAQPTRESICSALRAMRWLPYKVSAMKKDMRIPGRQGASVTLWTGLARWRGPHAYITSADPLYFEDASRVQE